jgi:hypothetical protein
LVHTKREPQEHYTTWGESQRMFQQWQSY